MAKPVKNQTSASYQKAIERARQHPSQIADVKAIVSGVEKELDTPDFSVRAELHRLLAEATTPEKQRAVLADYRQGLEAAAQEGRIHLRKMWQTFFNDEHVSQVLVDRNRERMVVSTEPEEEAKHAGIYSLDFKNGKKSWLFPMKKNQSAWRMLLGESALFFTTQSHSDDENHHHTSPLYVVALANGSMLTKWLPADKNAGDIGSIHGVFGGIVLIRVEWSGLYALNVETQKEGWRVNGSLQTILDDGFLVTRGERELVWLDKNGAPQKNLKIPFPKKDKGSVGNLWVSDDPADDSIYFTVYDCWQTYDKNFTAASRKEHGHIIFYAVGRRDAKVRWSFAPKVQGMRCESILPVGDHLYFCGEKNTFVLTRSSGKLVRELSYGVRQLSGKLFFHTDPPNAWLKDEFTFYARDVETSEVKWQRKNFRLINTKNNLLFGGVGSCLVVLDEATGKERASIQFNSEPVSVGFVDDNSFWVISRKAESLEVYQMSDKA